MKKLLLVLPLTVLVIVIFTGCSSKTATITGQNYNTETGDMEEIAYSNVLDGKAMIVPGTIGLYMLMELDEKKISAMYKLKQSMGALGPDDIDVKAKLTFFLYNSTDKQLALDLNLVRTSNQMIEDESVHLVIPAGEAIQHPVGRLSTSWYKTDMPIEFSFTYTGKTGGGTLILERRTVAELAEMQQKLAAAQSK